MRKALASVAIVLTICAMASAHRLDEYLQATRLALAQDSIVLKIDLTAGVDIAPAIFAFINTDHDGRISDREGRSYANQLLNDVVLELDGQRQRLILVRTQFPSFKEMSAGIGVVRIEAQAQCAIGAGHHSVSFQNNHRTELSAYLVNALVPAKPNIEITEQQRDERQRRIQIGFSVKS